MEYKCEYADERDKRGYCKRKGLFCDGSGDSFAAPGDADRLATLDRKDICAKSSLWGNYYFELTAQDVADLISGKCLALTGDEYGIFLSYKREG